MDEPSVKTEKPKLEELTHALLIVLLKEAMERIQSLEKKTVRHFPSHKKSQKPQTG
jgi:hypothetical protein